MELKNAISIIEELESQTDKKSELKIYQEFIQILKSLEERDLLETEIQAIEFELDKLQLDSTKEGGKKQISMSLKEFKKYLKATFSLTTKGYYTSLGVGLGSSIGILFGIVFLSSFERSLSISLGVGIGMLIGLVIGRNYDAQAEASNKTI